MHSARAVRTNLSPMAFHARGLWRGRYYLDPACGEDRVERGCELGVPVPDQVGELVPSVGQVGGELAGQLRGPGCGREPSDAQQVHVPRLVLDDERTAGSATLRSRCGRSPRPGSSRRVRAGRCASGRRVLPGKGIRWERRILRMVPAPVRCPRRRSSPWIRTTPQRGLSLASLTINFASSLASGGRPGAFGWVHFLATMRRCQRSSVPGVTIRCARSAVGRIRANAANSARSAQSTLGLELPRRRATNSRSLSLPKSRRYDFSNDDRE